MKFQVFTLDLFRKKDKALRPVTPHRAAYHEKERLAYFVKDLKFTSVPR